MAQIVPIPPPESRAPKSLKKAGKALWRAVIADFQLEPHHLAVLLTACEALDRAVEARAQVDKDGLTYLDSKGGIHAHPCVNVEKDARILMLRSLRELSLDSESIEAYTRPSRIAGRYRSG